MSRLCRIKAFIVLLMLIVSGAFAEELNTIIFNSKIKRLENPIVGSVSFPHKLHAELYDCGRCHPSVFIEKIGANDITMQKNIEGKYCGAEGCHNSADAFPLYVCDLCHLESKSTAHK